MCGINDNHQKSNRMKLLLITAIFLSIVTFTLAQESKDCKFDVVGGECKIENIVASEEALDQEKNAGYRGVNVFFSFKPVPKVVLPEEIAPFASADHVVLLRLNNGLLPGQLYMKKYNLKRDAIFPCAFKINRQGHCDPIMLDIKGVDPADDFEQKMSPQVAMSIMSLAQRYLEQARLEFQGFNIDMAIETYTKAIEEDPKLLEAYLERGWIYECFKGKYEEAIEDYSTVIRLNPLYATAYLLRGQLYKMQERYEEALRDFSQAILLNPALPAPYFEKAKIYEKLDREDEAMAFYKEFMRWAIEDPTYIDYNPLEVARINKKIRAYDRKQAMEGKKPLKLLVRGEVNREEIGGEPLFVVSLINKPRKTRVNPNGSFNTKVVAGATQFVFVVDKNNALRAAAVSIPSFMSEIEFDASSVAKYMLFEPSLEWAASENDRVQLKEIEKRPCYLKLVEFLKKKLFEQTFDEIRDALTEPSSEIYAIINGCSESEVPVEQ